MLKTASSVLNAIGALNYAGTWNASTNNPTLTSGVGTKGNYYVVSVAGTTTLDGISLWSVGDWAVFNGTAWQKVDGSSSEAFSSITVTGLTGYMYANNTSPVTASTTIPTTALSGTVSLTSQVSGTLPTANGGTALTSFTSGGILYATSTSALTTSSNLFYGSTGLGIVNNVLTSNGGNVLGAGSNIQFAANAALDAYGMAKIQGYLIGNGGTGDYGHLDFYTKASGSVALALSTRMFASGGVSIGNTTDPGAKNLSVSGTGTFSSNLQIGASATTGVIALTGANTGGGIGIWVDNSAGNGIGLTGETGAYNSYISTTTATNLSFGTNGVVRATLDTSGNLSVNGVIKIGSNQAVNGPAVSAYSNSSQTLSSSTWTKITFGAKEYDTNNNFASSRFTPTVAGYYQIVGSLNINTSQTQIVVSVYKNGSPYKYGANTNGLLSYNNINCQVYLNGTTDYVEIYGLVVVGQSTGNDQTLTYFQSCMMRGA